MGRRRRTSDQARDEAFMRLALRLAARGRGRTSPNPLVGAVVVRGGRVLATGYHRRAGLDHAEVAALRRLGLRARGADLYVTLEPCNHHGRTPPCTEAVIHAGVRRVIVGMRDPCRLVDGRGIRRLRRAGIAVEVGLLGDECRRVNEHFVCAQERGRPFVTWKAAVTLDGRIATRRGDSRWVTGARARDLGHALRDTHDAILVGAGTVRADDPLLTNRRRRGRDPVRVVLDGRLTISPRARLLHSGSPAPTLVVCSRGAPAVRQRALEAAGAEVLRLPGRGGRVDARALLATLRERDLLSVLIEGGGETAATFLEAGLVDKVVVFVAPKLVGGKGAIPMLAGRGVSRMAEAVRLCDIKYRQVGEEMVISGYVHRDR
jgi:diaminohydroxyphosphoribosylaminopyrimidine deaminase / 5-amino-6-(5-phosphoribosylamino)uracil reductase